MPGRFSSLIPEPVHGRVLIAVSIAVGAVGWNGHVLALPLAMLFPALWAHARSRSVAGLVSAGYFLAASRGLPQGVANYYASDLWPGLLLWIAASLFFVLVHALLWTRRPEMGRALRYLEAAVLMAVPPVGIVGWAHPLTSAGVLFPGWGWWGLAVTAAGLAVMTTRWWPAAAIAATGFWLWSAATWTPLQIAEGWKGVDLHEGQNLGRDVTLDRHRDMIATVRAAADEGARVVFLPESAIGFWTATVEQLWRNGLRDVHATAVMGAAILDRDGYDNVMIAVSGDESVILYRERMPVPVSMWQPWRGWVKEGEGAKAHFFATPVVTLDGTKIAPLICYEQLIVWPILQSALYSPDIIVAIGNGWWTVGTSIIAIQQASTSAWARLFAIPVVTAFNT